MRNDFMNECERRSFLALVSLILFALFACLARVLQDTRDVFSEALAVWAVLSFSLSLALPPLIYLIAISCDDR